MKKRLLSLFMSAVMLVISVPMTLSVSANGAPDTSHIIYKEYPNDSGCVAITMCESVDGFSGDDVAQILLDKSKYTQGMSSVSYRIQANDSKEISIIYSSAEKIDATLSSHIEFDIYFNKTDVINYITSFTVYLDSTVVPLVFSLDDIALNQGWNHITVPLADGKVYEDYSFDITSVSKIRLSIQTANTIPSTVIKLDKIAFTNGNGIIVEPKQFTMCESVTGFYMTDATSVTLDTQNKVAGNASVSYNIGANSSNIIWAVYTPSEALNATGLTHIEMDVYLENDDFIQYASGSQLEFSSAGECDVEEVGYNILGKLKTGWTHLVLPLSSGAYSSATSNKFDISQVDYMRFFVVFSAGYTLQRAVINFDNICFTNGKGVPVYQPKKGAYKSDDTIDYMPDYGDLDESGSIDASDALSVLQQSVSKRQFTNRELVKADVNNDAEISSSDALNILQYSVKKVEFFDIQRSMSCENSAEIGTKKSRLVKTKYYSNRAVVADTDVIAFGAVGDGVHDDYYAFQMAIDYVETLGGGTVFVPEGKYRISRALRIARGVTLKGDAPIITDGEAKTVEGTVLYAYTGRNDEKAPSFIQMYSGSGIQNLSIYYPQQDADNIVPYPYTVFMAEHYGISIENVNFVNSYAGIKMGSATNSLQNIVNVTGTVLSRGLYLDHNLDICRMENIHFSPEYWINSGLAQMSSNSANKVRDFTYKNSIGFLLEHIDWIYLSDVYIDKMAAGIHLSASATGSGGGPNGQIYNVNIKDCNIGIQANYINAIGMMVTKGKIEALIPFRLCENFTNTLTLNNLEMTSNGEYCIYSTGTGNVTLDRCTFNNKYQNAVAGIRLEGGTIHATNSTFTGYGTNVILDTGAGASRLVNCNTLQTLTTTAPSKTLAKTWDADYKTPTYTEKDYSQQLITLPSGDSFIDIKTYPGFDQSKDVSEVLQAAIDETYSFGGGIVYFPAGRYVLNNPIIVKPGVEVRGSANAPHHSRAPATIFFTTYGRCATEYEAETATALFTLKSKAGLSGFKVQYSDQYSDGVFRAYSHTIRGDGMAVYVNNVTATNPYYGIDLYTNKCDGHVVNGFGGSPLRAGVTVGGDSAKGIVKNCQLIIHYYTDNPYNTYVPGDVGAFQDANFECYIVKNTKEQIFYNNFTFGVLSGMVIDDGADAFILTHGTDAGVNSITFRGTPAKPIEMVNTQLVSFRGGTERTYVNIEDSFNGKLTMIQTNMWGDPGGAVYVNSGDVTFVGGTILRSGKIGIRIKNDANFTMTGISIRQTDSLHDFVCASADASLTVFANHYMAGKGKASITNAKLTTCDW